MRTESTTVSPAARTAARVRAELLRARRRFVARPAALRWSAGGVAVAALAALVYAASAVLPATTGGYVAFRPGVKFSSDDLIAIARALDARRVEYRVDRQNHVEIASDQVAEANDALAKLDVGPKRIEDIRKESLASNPFDSLMVAEQRQAQVRSALLEGQILHFPGVVSAYVKLNKPVSRGGARSNPGAGASAFVMVETEDDRELTSQTVETIQSLIAGNEPEIKRDAVTVFDRKGRRYLDAMNPALGAQAHTRARQEALRQEILDKLPPIHGVEVSVKLVPGPLIPPPSPLPPLPLPVSAAKSPEPPPAEEAGGDVRLPSLSMGVNQPLEFPPDEPGPGPGRESEAAAPRARPVASAAAPAVVPSAPTPVPAPAPESAAKARVWVKVPRRYFLRAVGEKDPSLEDLQPFVERTEKLIAQAVRHVVPPGELEEPVAVSVIPEDRPEPRVVSASAEARRGVSWWVPAGVAAGAAAALTWLASRLVASRRPFPGASGPAADPAGRARGRVYKIDEPSSAASGPGPSERVRELIRLNPEAAASVLHRWTGHGQGQDHADDGGPLA